MPLEALRQPATIESLDAFHEFVLSRVENLGAAHEVVPDIRLVLEEVLTNIVFYAYPDREGDVEVVYSIGNTGDIHTGAHGPNQR